MTQEEITYRLVRARRRTLAIHILPDGSVEVRAPMQMVESRIRQFVAEKRGWITKKQGETLERQRLRRETRLSPGDSVVLLDRPYRLETAAPGEVPGLAGERILLPENPGKEETAAVLEDVCRRLGRDYFPRRVAELAEGWGFSFQSVSVTGARTRWERLFFPPGTPAARSLSRSTTTAAAWTATRCWPRPSARAWPTPTRITARKRF